MATESTHTNATGTPTIHHCPHTPLSPYPAAPIHCCPHTLLHPYTATHIHHSLRLPYTAVLIHTTLGPPLLPPYCLLPYQSTNLQHSPDISSLHFLVRLLALDQHPHPKVVTHIASIVLQTGKVLRCLVRFLT